MTMGIDWEEERAYYDEELERELEERKSEERGTAACDGLCDPICTWCLLAHPCPEECGGGSACPYTHQSEEELRERRSRR